MENAEDLGNALGIVKDILKDPGRQVRELRKKALVHSQANLLTLATQIGGVNVGIVSRLSENGVSQHWDELFDMWFGPVSQLGSERKMDLLVRRFVLQEKPVSHPGKIVFCGLVLGRSGKHCYAARHG